MILNCLKNFWRDEKGLATVEIVVLIVVLIGLAIIFKNQIGSILESIFEKIRSTSGSI